ncbi:SRPBCC family protein [Aminobacter anthyllidis]|uniref:SRPBCC family protein n=1 Tax=Aminobacter anthyllidis TaxID=1035067 RepID=UPI00245711FA|nr:SRPBCC family protein [Aminobacter anthyllidis]MDH4988069.1 SRPBCC family protein [Aminobacter anthyllidis]
MTAIAPVQASFSIDRFYAASPAEVFAAFSNAERKRRWFAEGEGWQVDEFSVDFRVGGSERSRFRFQGGPEISNDTTYLDIVTDQRIVIAYVMALAGIPFSASLATIEFKPEGDGTRLTYVEQDSFLDGQDGSADREAGCRGLLDLLAGEVEKVSVAA